MAARGADVSALLVMGVAGSGKSTIAALMAGRLGWTFRDADDFHPPENVAKMSAGVPLTDADREPWLAAIAAWIDEKRATGRKGVVTCSALKRAYRDVLIGGRDDVRLVFLQGDRALVGARMAARRDHFMPTALLDSQFATLEAPTPDEQPVVVHVGGAPEEIVAAILSALDLAPVTKA